MQKKPDVTFNIKYNQFKKLCAKLISGKNFKRGEKKLVADSEFMEIIKQMDKSKYSSREQLEGAIKKNINILELYKDILVSEAHLKKFGENIYNELSKFLGELNVIMEPERQSLALANARSLAEEARREKEERARQHAEEIKRQADESRRQAQEAQAAKTQKPPKAAKRIEQTQVGTIESEDIEDTRDRRKAVIRPPGPPTPPRPGTK